MNDNPLSASWIHRLLVNRWLGWALAAPLLLLIMATALQYHRLESGDRANAPQGSMVLASENLSKQRVLNDYDDFYIVGRLFREGDILAAYDNDYLLAAQKRFTGAQVFMPWAYPPQLTALVPLLPLVGAGWSFLLFMGGTLALYLMVLRRFDPTYAGAALLTVYPAIVLNARLGQNGFMTAALIGLFLLLFSRRRDLAGLPLGLMALKPHMGIAIGVLALLERRWKTLAIGFAIVFLTSAAATVVLGTEVWPAFLQGVDDAGGYLRAGSFPLYRMSSVYAGFRSFGVGPDTSLAAHGVAAVIGLGLLVFAYARRLQTNRLLALTALVTVFISPYNYDYDHACLAIAAILVLPELLDRANLLEVAVFYALCWIGTGSGLAQHFRAVLIEGTIDHPHGSSLNWSLQAIGVLAAASFAAHLLRRDARSGYGAPACPLQAAA